jgi:hypothetical protein
MSFFSRLRWNRPRIVSLDICLDRRAALDQLLATDLSNVRFSVPSELCTSRGAFCFGGWHPFVRELLAPGTLRSFYAAFQPRSLAELYFLPADRQGSDLSPRLVPWYESKFGDYKQAPLEPSTFYGPASLEIVRDEEVRLHRLRQAIETNGYRPDRFGDIGGYVLQRGDEVRFFVHGGRHRAATLAALGQRHIPVKLRPGVPPVVDVSSLSGLPFVTQGLLDEGLVRAIFDRFFDWSGREQAARVFPAAAQVSEN